MRIGKRCSGCRACEQVCPKSAITMAQDKMGFLVPHIDEAKCVSCGMCEKACHLLDKKGLSFRKPNLFVAGARNKNEAQRYSSTSGGIFCMLSSVVISEGGVVYGAAFDSNFYVRHIRITDVSEITLLMGSKYVQSDTNQTFSQVLDDLQKGKKVLYSGVPCQIAGLQSFLAAKHCNMENLITVEVICHGSPSPLVWKEYLLYAEKHICHPIRAVYFRSKAEGWHARIKVRFLGLYSEKADFNPPNAKNLVADSSFIKLFLENLILRDECHKCNYARRERVADITLCDFWGIENTPAKILDDDKGVSGLIVHSETGMNLWNKIASDCDFMEVGYDIIAQNQQTMNVPFSRPSKKDSFWDDFLQNGWSCTRKYITEDSVKNMEAKQVQKKSRVSILQKIANCMPFVSKKKWELKNEEYMSILNDMRDRLIHIEDKVNSMKDYLIALRSLDD